MRKLFFIAALMALLTSCLPTPPPSGACNISTANPATIYVLPSAAATVFGTLSPGETVEATAKTADGFYGFDPGVAQAGNVGLFRLRWILKTNDVTTTPGCAGIPTVVGPITGICYAMIDHDTPIYSSPDTTSALVTTLHRDDYEMITAHASGWFTLDLNVGSPSLGSLGYLEESALGGVKGPCEGF
jgi:hypothetical protein